MKTENLQKNRVEKAQRTLWFFGTAPSQKTPSIRIHSLLSSLFSKLFIFSLFFALSSAQTYALITSGVASKAGSLSNGLIGYWTFDGKNLTNATATNSAGTSYDGALTNMTATSSVAIGKIGQALTFDGSNQYVNVGNNPLVGATKFTYSTWIKVSTSDFTGAFKTLVDDATGDANVNNGIVMGVDDRGGASPTAGITAMFHTATGCTLVYSSNIFSSTSQWYHITLTYNGVSTPTLYVNGASRSYTTGVCSSGSGVYVPRSANMWLGAVNNGSFYFKGIMDDVRIYNRALSASEVLALYNMAGNITRAAPTGPVRYWKFDNNTLTSATATDSSVSKVDGTLVGSPTVVTGKFGQALSFNGSSQYVSSTISNTTTFAISAWFKRSQSASYGPILEYSDSSNRRYSVFIDGLSPGFIGVLYSNAGTNSYKVQTSGTRKDDGQWHHVVAMSAGDATPVMYIDGVQVTLGNNIGTPSAASSPNILEIGTFTFTPGATYFFGGQLDDIRLYNRTLSQSEVTALYKNPQTASTYGASVATTNPISRGLVSNITFDGKYTNTSTSTDVSGTGNDGGLSAAPVFALGKVGQALSFNGSSYFVNLGNAANLQLSNGTISAWVKGSGCTGASGYCGIITKGNAYSMYTLSNVFGSYDWGGGAFRTSGINIADGKWHHVAETFQSGVSNGTVLYLDGVPVLTTTMTVNAQLYAAEIGRGGTNGGTGQLWNGLIDDARIYNRVLTAKEILALYKMGAK